jgi:hypothetical protein
MKKLALLITTFSLLATAAPAMATHSWGGYHWARPAGPFTVALGDNVGSAWDTHLTAAALDWSQDSSPQWPGSGLFDHPFATNPLNASVGPGSDIGREKRCAATTRAVQVCNAKYGYNGWLGVASVWASGTHITQATVKLNDTYSATAKYNTATWRAAVTCQEIGHTFGLDHQDETGANFSTCMDYANNPGDRNMHPNQDDLSMLGSLYQHGDTSTPAPSVTLGSSGRGLRRVHDDVFEEDLGDGNKRFVFVYWTTKGNHFNAPDGA